MQKIIMILALAIIASSGIKAQSTIDTEVNNLMAELMRQLNQQGQIGAIAVADFTNLTGQVTQLGKYLAEECTYGLLGNNPRGFSVVDRSQLGVLLAEAGLDAQGLVQAETAGRLGQIRGIDVLILGTLTPTASFVRVNLKAIRLNSTDLLAMARGNITKTPAIAEMEGARVTGGYPTAVPAPTGVVPSQTIPNTTSLVGATPSPPPLPVLYRHTNLTIELIGCRQTGANVECNLRLTSADFDTDIHLNGANSKLVNAAGQYEYTPTSIKLADRYGADRANKLVVADRSIQVTLYFANLRTQIETVSLLSLSFWSPRHGQFVADLRNFAVQR